MTEEHSTLYRLARSAPAPNNAPMATAPVWWAAAPALVLEDAPVAMLALLLTELTLLLTLEARLLEAEPALEVIDAIADEADEPVPLMLIVAEDSAEEMDDPADEALEVIDEMTDEATELAEEAALDPGVMVSVTEETSDEKPETGPCAATKEAKAKTTRFLSCMLVDETG